MKRRKKNGGFSLVEMLLVLTVVGIILAFATPNVFSLMRSRTLTSEGALLRNQLTFAQQIAVSKNADVEVRFFRWENDGLREGGGFGGYQLYQYDPDGVLAPISTFFRVREPTVISSKWSTLLIPVNVSRDDRLHGFSSPRVDKAPAPTGFGGGIENTEYVSFRFRPDGSTDLANKSTDALSRRHDTWYITLTEGENADREGAEPEGNYICLQVNPFNGAVTEFRPMVE